MTFLGLSFLCTSLCAQVTGLDLLGRKKYVDVPFEIKQGFIIVQVRFQNTVNLNFIFDTGAENTILFEKPIADLLQANYSQRIKITGSDLSGELYAQIARRVTLGLDGANPVLRDIVVLEDNILLLEEKLGIKIDGILGGSFFQNLIVSFNFLRKKIRLINPNFTKIQSTKNFKNLDIKIHNHKPYITAKTTLANGTILDLVYLIDTGASLPFLIHTDTDSLLSIPDKTITGNLGFGISGALKGYVGTVNELALGGYLFPNLITSFQDMKAVSLDPSITVRNGLIGSHLLRRFHIIIDYLRGKMYLKPIRKNKYADSFDYDRSGIVVFAVGENLNEFFIKEILANSPASEIDLRPGDIITKIGLRKTGILTLEDINHKFQKKPGKKIKLQILRNGKKLKKELILRDWFHKQLT